MRVIVANNFARDLLRNVSPIDKTNCTDNGFTINQMGITNHGYVPEDG